MRVLQEGVILAPEERGLRVDTPYILQDGALLRVHLRPVPGNGHVVVSDGAYALEQLAIFLAGPALHHRYPELRRIAEELDLEWDEGEFRFSESDLDTLARRVAILAEAVDRSLSLAQLRPMRTRGHLRAQISSELREMDLEVRRRARIEVGSELPAVTVDYRVRRNGSEAAVEVLTSKTAGGAAIAVDRAVANFHVLDRGGYPGWLFAVYDEDSPTGEKHYQERFRAASPERAELVAGGDAVPAIAGALGLDWHSPLPEGE